MKDFLKKLGSELGFTNVHAMPQVIKVSLNVGIGSAYTAGNKDYSHIEEALASITGQKPNMIKARKSVSNFKLREGMPNGLMLTLRGERMHSFLTRLTNIALPRVRDFRGISVSGFDGRGNFSLGIKDMSIFPEVKRENMTKELSMQINVQTSAENNYAGYRLLKSLGFPFRDEVKNPHS